MGTVATGAWRLVRGAMTPAASHNVVAVFPFSTWGATDAHAGGGIAALLASAMDGAGALTGIVPPISGDNPDGRGLSVATARGNARRVGAGLVVTGEVVYNAGAVRMAASLYDAATNSLIGHQVTVEGDSSQTMQLVDRLAALLLASRHGGPMDRVLRAAILETRSLAAAKAYIIGEEALTGGNPVTALEAFRRATELDSTFALGYYRLSIAADWAGRDSVAQSAASRAVQLSGALADRDRQLVTGLAAWRDGRGEDAEGIYRVLLDDYSDDVEAWLQLGEVLFHDNPLRGQSTRDARHAFERVIALDSTNVDAMMHLARISSVEGKPKEADELVQRASRLASSMEVLESRSFRTFALSDRPGQKRVTRDLVNSPPRSVEPRLLIQAAIYVDDVQGARDFAKAVLAGAPSPSTRGFAHRLEFNTQLAEGRWSDAKESIKRAMAVDYGPSVLQYGLAESFSFVPVDRGEIEAVRKQVAEWHPAPAADSSRDGPGGRAETLALTRIHVLGLLSARLGDELGAKSAISELGAGRWTSRGLRLSRTIEKSILAHLAASAGKPADALALLEHADWEWSATWLMTEAGDRFLRASLLLALGREAEAAGWFRGMSERAAYELPFLAPAERQLAEIAARDGKTEESAAHRKRAEALWRAADPSVRQLSVR